MFSDELNHASIIDGCRLSGAETFVYRHGDVEHLAWGLRNADGRGALIVTDGVFSMDGDVAPLEEIVELARRHDVRVMVDDAHGTGTLGPGGRGAVAEAGLDGEVDVIVGTLGKALGSYGAFAACDHALMRYLVNTARPLIFSTGLPPAAAAAAMASLELLQEQPRRVERLADNAAALRDELAQRGLRRVGLGDADRAADSRRRRARDADLRGGAGTGRVRAGDPAADGARRHVAAAAGGDGVAYALRTARGRADPRPAPRCATASVPPPPSRSRRRRRPRPRARCGCSTATPRSRCRGPHEPRPLMRGLFVTGTDTGVGKTVVAGSIVAALRARGERVAAYKPVVTGLDEPAVPGWPRDHELLAAAAGTSAEAVAPHRFGPPVSPHLAAELAGAELDLEAMVVAASAAAAEARASVLVAEGVGGLLVPLTRDRTVRDLAVALAFPLVVAARPGLGTISHTLLTLEAARAAGLAVAGVVITPWPVEPSVMAESNRATIARLGAVDVATLPPLPDGSPSVAGGRRRDAAARRLAQSSASSSAFFCSNSASVRMPALRSSSSLRILSIGSLATGAAGAPAAPPMPVIVSAAVPKSCRICARPSSFAIVA